MTKRFGFTLAEVLITLGIIGVVAAMTMPTLMNSTQGAQYKAAYKKALSAISQAVTLNVALDEWNFADADGGATYNLKELLSHRMNVVRDVCATGCKETNSSVKDAKGVAYKVSGDPKSGLGTAPTGGTALEGTNTTLFFNDGIMFTFPTASAGCTKGPDGTAPVTGTGCKGFIDVNGVKAPNKFVKCDNSSPSATSCEIKNPTDVYPVIFYDQTILPNSTAARAVLYSK